MSLDFTQLIETCEAALRAGQGQVAAHHLALVPPDKVPRAFCLPLATLCRRSGLMAHGLKILTPIVHPGKSGLKAAPSSAELAEFAVLLERCGAVKEALRVLHQVDTAAVPIAHLYRAFCHFKSWDYAAAIPELKKYLGSELAPYARLVGQVNFAAAQVITGDFGGALEQLRENIELSQELDASRLRANCLELLAQVHFHRRDFLSARQDLAGALDVLGPEKTSDMFFIRKWQTVILAFESSETAPINELRRQAELRQDWETVRECDLFRLMIAFNERDFLHLYFGTPFASYRGRITQTLGVAPMMTNYVFGREDSAVLDLRTGKISGREVLNPGKKVHQTFAVLLQDLYRPQFIGGLFADLFPEEYFNIYSSPGRVHQILFRARRWLSEQKIPVTITENNRTYALRVDGHFGFKLSALSPNVRGFEAQWSLLTDGLGERTSFTAKDSREVLQLSAATCKRVLKWGVESGKVRREGTNSASVYHLATTEISKRAA